MQTLQKPSEQHEQFNAICAELEEWDTLPTLTSTPEAPAAPAEQELAAPTGHDPEFDEDAQRAPLDQLILAGLVSPY